MLDILFGPPTEIFSALLEAEEKKFKTSSEKAMLYAAGFGFLNLVFCGFADWYILGQFSQNSISLFLLVESSLYLLFSLGYFKGRSEEILSKTDVIDLPPGSRFLLVLRTNVRHPITRMLLATLTLFWIVLLWGSPSTLIVTLTFSFFLFLNIATLSSILFIEMSKAALPAQSIAVIVLFAVFVLLVGSIVFQFGTMLTAIPFVSWTALGIVAFVNGGLFWIIPLALNVVVFVSSYIVAMNYL